MQESPLTDHPKSKAVCIALKLRLPYTTQNPEVLITHAEALQFSNIAVA